MKDSIIIKNAHSHNLKGIDVEIPRGRMTVVTGISGSGKTSLAFDTLFAEGQRRYAQSLSSFARQFLGRMQKPAVDSITGLPPAIAIEQKVNTRNPRSTVGSVTEIYDYLRLLFARIGRTYSPISGVEVRCDSVASVENEMRELACGGVYREAYLLVPFGWQNPDCRQVEHLLSLKEEGYVRLFALDDAGGRRLKIDRVLQDVESVAGARVWLLLERVELASLGSEDAVSLLRDSLRLAFGRGDGHIALALFDAEGKPEIKEFSSLFEADGMSFQKPEEWLFNYNSPLGACKVCGGLGKTIGIDENLVVPNKALSIYQDAIACWRGEVMRYFKEEVILNAAACGIDIHCPWRDLPEEARRTVWQGNQYITGVLPFFGELEKKRYKIQNKYMITRYSGKTVCSECGGHRLCREALYVRVGGKDIAQLMAMSAAELLSFFEALKLDSHDRSVAERPIKEICQRLGFLNDVGLGYLTMERHANTLSGGESQRVHLVSSLGNSLTGSMYILDEPSIGLHERDTERLIKVLYQLRDLGNTVVVVEHDERIIRSADWLIDIGPAAGSGGGEVVYCGAPPQNEDEGIKLAGEYPKSLTLKYLTGLMKIEMPALKRSSHKSVWIKGACEHNLKNIDVEFPLGVLTAVVGVSGSGKSTLVGDILYPAIRRELFQLGDKPGAYLELCGDLGSISGIEYVDQNPIGKSARSNPVTYLKVYDDIRHLFSEQPFAKINGFGHAHFSFNVDGGRCPQCQGEGIVKIPMQFMADVTMVCDSCLGKRFIPDILEVKYRDKDISEVLDMSVDQAMEFFAQDRDALPQRIVQGLQPLHDVGLGYVKLGQSSSTLSGGESQRVKLASFLGMGKGRGGGQILFIFDEPTTGLHMDDIGKLLASFRSLLDAGHSIVVVEHNPYIIAAADHIIELGPEGGDKGGYLI